MASISPTRAQIVPIVPDGTLPVNSIVTSQDNTTLITGGTAAGNNLFHSFEQFSIPTGSTAFFNNSSAIQNIISRVTGGSESNIDGLLRANGTANLFLLNPNGIIFGPNATLNIGGSFVGSTASAVNFADGTQFSATATQTTPLLTVSVPIGLQLGGTAGRIRVQGSGNTLSVNSTNGKFVRGDNPIGLQVQRGKTLALVGGNVTLEGGNLIAEGGRIELGSVAGPSQVSLTPTDKGWTLGYEGAANFQDIKLSGRASVDASGVREAYPDEIGGGDIQVQGRRVTLTDASAIFALNLGSKSGGAVTVNASDSVEVIGTSADGRFPSTVFTDTEGAGAAGDLTITTGQLLVQNGAVVTAVTLGAGDAGMLTVNASDSVKLSGTQANGPFVSGLSTTTYGAGAAGDLTITTGQLLVQDGAVVSAATYGAGDAGMLTVNASDSVTLNGSSNGLSSLSTTTYDAGAAGDLTITTKQLLVQDGAFVSASTYGAGDAGELTVNASDSVKLSGTGTTANGRYSSGLFAQVEPRATGVGGNLTIETGQLLIQKGAKVSNATFGTQSGGTLAVKASESVELIGESANGNIASGLFTSVQLGATGAGGNLTLETQQLSVRDGAQISTSTVGEGSGGKLTVKASESVELSGTSADGQRPSRLTARTGGTGNAGDLRIETGQLTVQDGAKVTVSSEGSGIAGNLQVQARSITLDNQGALEATTRSGNGGNITLQLQDLLLLRRNSSISTDAGIAGDRGNGGNIDINTDLLVAVPSEDSDIQANAYEGNGGRVEITTQGIFGTQFQESETLESDITVSSKFGVNGVVEINTQDVDPSQGLVTLPTQLVDASGLIASGCGATGTQRQSEFIVTGRGGLPENPSDLLSSDAVQVDLVTLNPKEENRSSPTVSTNPTAPAPALLVEAQGWVINNLGEVVLTATAVPVLPHSSWLPPVECHAP